MKLDATDLRYLSSDEFRVLTAVEIGSKNHEVVPTVLIAQISSLRHGGVNKLLGAIAKRGLVSKVQNSKYDGYRLTYGGYDYLAMRALSKRDSMHSVGNQIGVGKESDIYIVADANGREMVLKLHRLGRISFRTIKEKRDYLGKRQSASWMYMSRLAAQKEWAFMKVLYENHFPVPRPIDQARHCILMEFLDAYPLRQISNIPSPGTLYSALMDLIVRFAHAGLIHGDFNEFNILIQRESGEPIVIDFPQMVSTSHENAEWYFNRDVECIRKFFKRRFRYESALYPRFKNMVVDGGDTERKEFRLDVVVSASGFRRQDMKVLEEYMETVRVETSDTEGQNEIQDDDEGDEDDDEDDGDEDEDDEDEDEEDEDEDKEDDDGIGEKEVPEPILDSRKYEALSEVCRGSSPPLEELSDPSSHRSLSRSPPRSRSVSPSSLEKMTANLNLNDVRGIVSSDLSKIRARQQRKHLSKRGARHVGRPQGSKAKQDKRVKVDKSSIWE